MEHNSIAKNARTRRGYYRKEQKQEEEGTRCKVYTILGSLDLIRLENPGLTLPNFLSYLGFFETKFFRNSHSREKSLVGILMSKNSDRKQQQETCANFELKGVEGVKTRAESEHI